MEPTETSLLVPVGGRWLAGSVAGQGSPTVVLEMGLGARGSFYDDIARQLAAFTCVVWYDRAGLGHSDPAPTPRTIQDLVVDLHALLHTANIPGPYILVGHSLGGLTVRFYREQYPEEVAALVLLDSAHEDQQQRQVAILPPEHANESNALAQLRQAWTVSWNNPFGNEEHIDNRANSELMRTCGTLGSTLLLVISRGRADRDPAHYPPGLVEQLEQIWRQMQWELAQLSLQSQHIIASKSGHLINKDEPELVIESIRQTVLRLRGKGAWKR